MQQRHNKRSALLRAGPRSDGDTQKVAMQETPSSDFSLAFVMPPIRNKWRNTVEFCLQTRGREYICYNHSYFCWKVWTTVLWEQVWLLSATDATASLDHVQRGEKVLHLVQQKRGTGGQERVQRVVWVKKKTHPSIKITHIWEGSVTLYAEGDLGKRQPPRMKTTVSLDVPAHVGGIQDVPNQSPVST